MSSFMRMNLYTTKQNQQQQQLQQLQQLQQQPSQQQNVRLGATHRRVCAALVVQGNKRCGSCGHR